MKQFIVVSFLLLGVVIGAQADPCVITDDVLIPCEPVGPNSNHNDWGPSISLDGTKLYFSTSREGSQNSHIYLSTKVNGDWQPAVRLGGGINTYAYQSHPDISADGLTLYYPITNAGPGNQGSSDIYVSDFVDGNWSAPRNINDDMAPGADPINTYLNDLDPSISVDGQTLYFASVPSGQFGANIYMTTKNADGLWQSPVLVPVINSANHDREPDITPDGKTLYFLRVYPGDTKEIMCSKWDGTNWGLPTAVTGLIDAVEPSVSAKGEMFFCGGGYASRRGAPGACGGDDIWVAQIEITLDALVDIAPDKLNQKSHGQWLTVYITLPEGYDVADIDTSSLAITRIEGESCSPNYTQPADLSFIPQVGDYDEDGIADLTVKFDRQILLENLCLDDVAFTIEGDLTTGEHFVGSDTIKVFSRGK